MLSSANRSQAIAMARSCERVHYPVPEVFGFDSGVRQSRVKRQWLEAGVAQIAPSDVLHNPIFVGMMRVSRSNFRKDSCCMLEAASCCDIARGRVAG